MEKGKVDNGDFVSVFTVQDESWGSLCVIENILCPSQSSISTVQVNKHWRMYDPELCSSVWLEMQCRGKDKDCPFNKVLFLISQQDGT